MVENYTQIMGKHKYLPLQADICDSSQQYISQCISLDVISSLINSA